MDYGQLDPGIRELVRDLRSRGFETTDSGDGVSKPASERVFEVPHVACAVDPSSLLAEADRLIAALPEGWRVEATYFPERGGPGEAVLLATLWEGEG